MVRFMRINLKPVAAFGLVVTCILGTSACSDDKSSGPLNPLSSSESAIELSSQDVMFLQMMIPHHEQAVFMSDVAQRQADSDAIKKLAMAISTTQKLEVNKMREWLTEASEPLSSDGHSMGTDGMLSEQEVIALRAANGKAFDRLFVKGMTAHHKGAIEMAKDEVSSGQNEKVKAFAVAVIALQGAEIITLKAIQKLHDLKSGS